MAKPNYTFEKQHMMDPNLKGYIGILMITVIMTVATVHSFKTANNTEETWANRPSVPGVLKHVSYSHGGSKNAQHWTISVKYLYEVKGIEYEGDELGGIKGEFIETEENIINKINSNGLKKGGEVKVYYNPKEPNESILFTDTTTDIQMGILALIITLIGVIGTVFYGIKIKNET